MTKRRDEEADRDVETRAEMEERHRRIAELTDPITGHPAAGTHETALWERIYDRLNSVNASYSGSREKIRSPEVEELEYPLAKAIGTTSLIRYHWPGQNSTLTGQNLTHHLRKSSRESVFRMFREANEVLFKIADEHDYFSENVEVTFDITDWPFYGDSDSDEYIRGTKPGRNYSYAWKYITLALVGTDTPLILAVLPVKDKSNTPEYVRRMLRLSQQYMDLGRVYMDAGTEFYNSDTISVIDEQGLEMVMQGRKSGKTIKQFLNGMARAGLRSSYYPYGVGDIDEDNYFAVGLKSDKTVKLRKEEADEPIDNYTYFYTNIDPEEISPEELGEAYRRRWGIETDFRKIKNDFLAQCGSKDPALRAFYFNFAGHLFNIWTVANILRAEENGEELSESKHIPATELMDAIEDDPHDLQIPTEPPETR